MFTNILNKIDFFRKILINTFFIIFLLGIFLFLLITPFLGDSTDKKKSILFLDASSQMSNNSSFFSKSYGLSNYEIVNAIEIAEKDNEIADLKCPRWKKIIRILLKVYVRSFIFFRGKSLLEAWGTTFLPN